MNWYIGQDIVAIKTHSRGVFKEGDIFTIKSLRTSNCKCGHILIDIGLSRAGVSTLCITCNTIKFYGDDILWFNEKCFRSLDELADISELTEVLKEPVFN